MSINMQMCGKPQTKLHVHFPISEECLREITFYLKTHHVDKNMKTQKNRQTFHGIQNHADQTSRLHLFWCLNISMHSIWDRE